MGRAGNRVCLALTYKCKCKKKLKTKGENKLGADSILTKSLPSGITANNSVNKFATGRDCGDATIIFATVK
jgi:hypothetical protein